MLGIVTALSSERRWIGATDPQTEIALSGVGMHRAENAARNLIASGATHLVSWGAAGGLDPELGPGTVVLPNSVTALDGNTVECDTVWRDRLIQRVGERVRLSTGRCLTVDTAATDPEQKGALSSRFGAVAVDMESAAIARVAKEHDLSWIAVRVVVDAADIRLPDLNAIGPDGQVNTARVLLRALPRPGLWRALLTLRSCHRTAGGAMRRVWHAAGPDLAWILPPDRR
jgi:adenosylhomocysteine nucleosidase